MSIFTHKVARIVHRGRLSRLSPRYHIHPRPIPPLFDVLLNFLALSLNRLGRNRAKSFLGYFCQWIPRWVTERILCIEHSCSSEILLRFIFLMLHTGLTNFFRWFYLHSRARKAREVLWMTESAIFWVFFWFAKAAQAQAFFSVLSATIWVTKRIFFFETACRTLQSTSQICGFFLLSFL